MKYSLAKTAPYFRPTQKMLQQQQQQKLRQVKIFHVNFYIEETVEVMLVSVAHSNFRVSFEPRSSRYFISCRAWPRQKGERV